jgi:Putative Actinobacterial Holin-X, holin superfamily III
VNGPARPVSEPIRAEVHSQPVHADPIHDERGVGDLLSAVVNDLSTLMRQELALAKAEVREEVTTAGKASGMVAAAGLAGFLTLLFGSAAAMWGLAEVMAPGLAALIVAVVWAIAAGALFAAGRARLRKVNPVPERTVETLKEDAQWLKNRRTSSGTSS